MVGRTSIRFERANLYVCAATQAYNLEGWLHLKLGWPPAIFPMNLSLYGPPGSGKTTVGKLCARHLQCDFVDVDAHIESATGSSVAELFASEGELRFRARERAAILQLAQRDNLVIATGGGALLDGANRTALEASGPVVCLRASAATIRTRLAGDRTRPLLQPAAGGAAQLEQLLAQRQQLYDSFALQLATDGLVPQAVAQRILAEALAWQPPRQSDSSPALLLGSGALQYLPRALQQAGLPLPALIITDANVAPLWGTALGTQLGVPVCSVPAGEAHKTLETMRLLYDAFLGHGLERSSVVLALGGGVLGDMAGFAAATYMRGLRWINAPTTLLAMVDASLGGKVGVDLPQGKNLVGAFHPPALVVSDPCVLATLPPAQHAAGLAEALKHGLIADAALFTELPAAAPLPRELLQRAIQVKLDIVARDPLEHGERAKLNVGHTIGHGIEAACGYTLPHGFAIGIGLLAEARLAVRMQLADAALPGTICTRLEQLGLPVAQPGLDAQQVRAAMQRDKKKHAGQLAFALPRAVGLVEYGLHANDADIMAAIESVCA